MARQVIFRDRFEDDIHAGILLDDGNIIAAVVAALQNLKILHFYIFITSGLTLKLILWETILWLPSTKE